MNILLIKPQWLQWSQDIPTLGTKLFTMELGNCVVIGSKPGAVLVKPEQWDQN